MKTKHWLWGIGALIGIGVISKRKKIMDYSSALVWDYISDSRIDTLHPKVRSKAREFLIKAEKQGIKLRVTSALRTYDEQNALYAKGRTAPGKIVTNAKGGQSFHNFGLAIDVVEIKNGKALWNNPNWNKIGRIGKSVGFEWGGDWTSFKDKPHFQYTFGNRLATLRDRYNKGKLKNGYVKLVA